MKKYLFTIFLLFALGQILFSQSKNSPTVCPTSVSINTEAVLTENSNIIFTAHVNGEVDHQDLGYIWIPYNARILKGQGSRTVTVHPNHNSTVTMKLRITGLNEICENEVIGGISIGSLPVAILFEIVGKDKTEKVESKLKLFFKKLLDHPHATAYFVNYGEPGEIEKRERLIRSCLPKCDSDCGRFVLVNKGKEKRFRTMLWIVPAGADPIVVRHPEYEKKIVGKCPEVMVIEPAIAHAPGDNAVFSVRVDGKSDYKNIGYVWSLDKNLIFEGQGTPAIKIGIPKEIEGSVFAITATVRITGFPVECINLRAEGTYVLAVNYKPRFVDEITKSKRKF